MKAAGIPFEEEVISLNADDFKQRVSKISGTGKVPALADGSVQVWESLAILEYLAERFPDAGMWPADAAARALARALAAEMHAGFVPLRRHLPMNMWRPVAHRELTPEVQANIRRIDAIWTDCRTRYGSGGPFLFGAFGATDAMYAPVVSRFHTYAVEVGALARMAQCGIGRALGVAGGRGGLADRYARMTMIATAAALAPAASKTKKCRGGVLIPARGRRKYTPIL
jgi:glutathione S-transferase